MRVKISAAALADMAEIGEFIAIDNPRRAASFLKDLTRACRSLSAMPLRYPLIDDRFSGDLRKLVHGADVVIYRPDEKAVTIVRIMHGARDYVSILSRTT